MNNNIFKNQLISLLTLMKSKAESKGLEPSVRTDSVIDMLKNTGVAMGYSQLSQLLGDPSVAPLVKSFDQDRIEITSDNDDSSTSSAPQGDDLDLGNINDPQAVDQFDIGAGGDDGSMGMGDMSSGMDLSAPQPQADPNQQQQPQQSLIPAGQSKEQQISTMAKRALSRGLK